MAYVIPRGALQGLSAATPSQLAGIQIFGGTDIAWPQLDVNHSLPALMDGFVGRSGGCGGWVRIIFSLTRFRESLNCSKWLWWTCLACFSASRAAKQAGKLKEQMAREAEKQARDNVCFENYVGDYTQSARCYVILNTYSKPSATVLKFCDQGVISTQ